MPRSFAFDSGYLAQGLQETAVSISDRIQAATALVRRQADLRCSARRLTAGGRLSIEGMQICIVPSPVFHCEDFYRRAMIHSMKRKVTAVRTLKQARTYVLQVGICGIFSDAGVGMPNLWEVVDLPDRQPGEKGWGQKFIAIWRWKDELPAIYPAEIFYGRFRLVGLY